MVSSTTYNSPTAPSSAHDFSSTSSIPNSTIEPTGVAAACAPLPGAPLGVPATALSTSTTLDEKDSVRNNKINDSAGKEVVVSTEDDPEMAGLTDEQRRIVAEQVCAYTATGRADRVLTSAFLFGSDLASQVYLEKRKPASFFELFRFHNRLELLLNVVGVIAAIGAGEDQSPRANACEARFELTLISPYRCSSASHDGRIRLPHHPIHYVLPRCRRS
jgi:hypothetical protein